jgi:hypothetical protein
MDDHEIISRSEAKARGLKTYFTGKPCPHGHVAPRQTSNGICRECAYDRTSQWRKQNWERKLRKYNRRYHADYYARNRLAVMEKRREYYQSNKPMVLHRTRERRLRDQIDPQGAAERRLKRVAECITDWMDD